MILEKFYKSLSSHIIGFAKVTSLEILTHLITKYAELEEEDVQDMNRKMKDPITGETLFEEFVDKIQWNQEAVAEQNPYSKNGYTNRQNIGRAAQDDDIRALDPSCSPHCKNCNSISR